MKRILVILVCGFLIINMFSCIKDEKPIVDPFEDDERDETSDAETDFKNPEISEKSPIEILTAVWNKYSDEEKFRAIGGDFDNIVDGAPGAFNITNKSSVESQLVCPDGPLSKVEAVASLFDAMNANSFTGAVYLLKEGQSVSEFSSEMKEAIRKNNWLCGSPEKYFITGINDRYVVVVFGSEERTNVFLNNLKEHYSFIDADIKSVA